MGIGKSDPDAIAKWITLKMKMGQWMGECQPRWIMDTKINDKALTFVIKQIELTPTFTGVRTGRGKVSRLLVHLKKTTRRKHQRKSQIAERQESMARSI